MLITIGSLSAVGYAEQFPGMITEDENDGYCVSIDFSKVTNKDVDRWPQTVKDLCGGEAERYRMDDSVVSGALIVKNTKRGVSSWFGLNSAVGAQRVPSGVRIEIEMAVGDAPAKAMEIRIRLNSGTGTLAISFSEDGTVQAMLTYDAEVYGQSWAVPKTSKAKYDFSTLDSSNLGKNVITIDFYEWDKVIVKTNQDRLFELDFDKPFTSVGSIGIGITPYDADFLVRRVSIIKLDGDSLRELIRVIP